MLDNKDAIAKAKHDIVLQSREKLSINGIKEIINFDEEEINIKTVCGDLTIGGVGLHINALNVDTGEAQVVGKISLISYVDMHESEKHSLLSRIFK